MNCFPTAFKFLFPLKEMKLKIIRSVELMCVIQERLLKAVIKDIYFKFFKDLILIKE